MKSALSSTSKYLDAAALFCCGILLILMVVVVFAQIIFRFFIGSSLSWSEELARYSMIWLSFLGASAGVKRGAHVGVEFLLRSLPEKKRILLTKLILALGLFFFLVVFWKGIFILKIVRYQSSPAMGISMMYPYMAISVGSFISLIHILDALLSVKGGSFK
ncbi:MAG: TRAP transporter small permease [Synergistetes bacterium]|nr:TRAP transporter small permease [Synergistota bacterium]